MMEQLQVDDLTLDLRRSARRKTMAITIERDGSLQVAAPKDALRADIEAFVRKKQFWIYTKLAEKALLRGSGLPPRFIDYVVVHELAHLHEPHHSENYWRRVERAMPDYGERKRWLAENGRYYALVLEAG